MFKPISDYHGTYGDDYVKIPANIVPIIEIWKGIQQWNQVLTKQSKELRDAPHPVLLHLNISRIMNDLVCQTNKPECVGHSNISLNNALAFVWVTH